MAGVPRERRPRELHPQSNHPAGTSAINKGLLGHRAVLTACRPWTGPATSKTRGWTEMSRIASLDRPASSVASTSESREDNLIEHHSGNGRGREPRNEMLADSLLAEEDRKSISVLVVDDEETLLDSSVSVLEHDGYQVKGTTSGSEAARILAEGRTDIVLLDLFMSEISGYELLHKALEARADTIVIPITGRPSVESSIRTMEEGAWSYLPKPFSATQLRLLVGRAAHSVTLLRGTGRAGVMDPALGNASIDPSNPVHVGESPTFRSVIALARKVAATDASVMITGESGTGKELVAQLIHGSSRRRDRELVPVNCAALPEPLLESEMFGHVKGAFTGASRDKQGLMEVADGGTLFLDELVEMSPMTQAKLLRVVQDGVVRRVGSSRTDAIVDVRFVSATNCDPVQAIEDGRLREDLYYRLGVVHIRIPPLRERPEDIPMLAEHFLKAYWVRHWRNGGRNGRGHAPMLTQEAVWNLQQRPWKGNVRELQNAMEHAVVLAEGRDVIEVSDLPEPARGNGNGFGGPFGGLAPGSLRGSYHEARDRVLASFEREYLTWALQETNGNVSEAARLAGVNRATLYRLLERHGLTKADVVEE